MPALGDASRLLTLPDPELDPLAPDAMLPRPQGQAPPPPRPQQRSSASASSPAAGDQAAAFRAAGIAKMEQGRWDDASAHFATAMKVAASTGRPAPQDAQARATSSLACRAWLARDHSLPC